MQGCLEHSYRCKHFVLNMLYIASSSIVIHFALAIQSYLPFVTPCYAAYINTKHLTAGLAFPVRHSEHSVCLLLCLCGCLVVVVFFVLINICTYLKL